ncbi:hypothetical protein ACA910_012571 [Epithemia clementina (nom. ined.)]
MAFKGALVLRALALTTFLLDNLRQWELFLHTADRLPPRWSILVVEATTTTVTTPKTKKGHRSRRRRHHHRTLTGSRLESASYDILQSFSPPQQLLGHYDDDSSSDVFSMNDLICYFYEQPLNHFDLPRNKSGTYQQRYCISNQFVVVDNEHENGPTGNPESTKFAAAPIFFYTGNESPLEAYIEHTGLLWEMAREFGAQVVFAEHRYEGQSIPTPLDMPACLAYSSSVQAIADYARLIRNVLWQQRPEKGQLEPPPSLSSNSPTTIVPRPVICFGGSYGGMLSAWMRMRYPQWVAGAIAASAPIWGFPVVSKKASHDDDMNNINSSDGVPRMDAAYAIVRHGLSQPYPPYRTSTADENEERNHCPNNLLFSYPLIHILGQEQTGLDFLSRIFRLCPGTPLETTDDLVQWIQTPWFDLAEGSFPYPSSYIPFALAHLNVTLPAWPLQTACWKTGLVNNYGIAWQGSLSNVTYNLSFSSPPVADAGSKYTIQVDWDQAHSTTPVSDWIAHPVVSNLLTSVREAVSIWYNMTHDVSCFDISQAAPNNNNNARLAAVHDSDSTNGPDLTTKRNREGALRQGQTFMAHDETVGTNQQHGKGTINTDDDDTCQNRMHMGSWPSLCCNEDMNLLITLTQGIGQDVFWPPTVPRSVQSYSDYVDFYGKDLKDSFCDDPKGLFGFPSEPDPWSNWLDLQYGNYHVLQTSSNIVFSNGLLDPWSAAGVILGDPSLNHNNINTSTIFTTATTTHRIVPGLTLQKHKNGIASLLLDYGGHHVDLMYSDSHHDPPSFTAARKIERLYVASWIQEFWNATAQNRGSSSIDHSPEDWFTSS